MYICHLAPPPPPYHLLLSLFNTCPTDFDYTLIQIKYHMHVGKLTIYKLRIHKIHRDATC